MRLANMRKTIWRERQWVFVVVSLIGLALVVLEVLEHHYLYPARLDGEFIIELLLVGVLFFICLGATLDGINHRRAQVMLQAPSRATAHVLVIENELIGGLVKHLLSREPDLNVVGVNPEDATDLITAIRQIHPSVVVMGQSAGLMNSTSLFTLPKDLPNMRFITVNAEDERVRVDDVRQVLVTGGTELAALVRGAD